MRPLFRWHHLFLLTRACPFFAGPGSRAMGDMLQGRRQDIFPAMMTIAPGESEMLLNAPIPIRPLDLPINGRSTLAQLESSGPVYVASLAQIVGLDEAGNETPPSTASWEDIFAKWPFSGAARSHSYPAPCGPQWAANLRSSRGCFAGLAMGGDADRSAAG